MCGERKNRPRKTPGRCKGRSGAFKIGDRSLYNWLLGSITECQECESRVIGVRCKSGSVDDAISSVPSSTGAGPIQKHFDSTIHPRRGQVESAARTTELL